MMFDTNYKYLWFDYHFDYSYRENLALKAELQKVSGPPPTPSMTTPVCTVSMLITLYGKHIYLIWQIYIPYMANIYTLYVEFSMCSTAW